MALDTFVAQQRLFSELVSAGICGGRVYDFVPESPSTDDGGVSRDYPYCEIGDALDEPEDIGQKPRVIIYQTIQLWTRYRGKKQVRGLADEVRAALHGKLLTTTDSNTLRVLWENTQVFPDTDGLTYRGVMRFKMTLEGECE